MVLPLIYSVFTYCGFGIRIRIYKGPEYGSNLDPDPQHFFFISGICIRLNTVFREPPIRLSKRPDTGIREFMLLGLINKS